MHVQKARRITAWIGAAALGAVTITPFASSQAGAQVITPVRIASAGPLQEIHVGAELNCQIKYAGEPLFLFFPSSNVFGACGTQLRLNGETFGPGNIPSGNQPTPFTPVSQSAVTGTGTAGDPFTVATVVRAGTTAITITQIDTYIVGQATLRTQTSVRNEGDANKDVVLYRAGDCYLDGLDDGLGDAPGAGAVACRQGASGRTMTWTPLSGGSTYVEGPHNVMWELIQNGHTFPNTAQSTGIHNNAAGLAWALPLPAGGAATVTSSITVSAPQSDSTTTTSTSTSTTTTTSTTTVPTSTTSTTVPATTMPATTSAVSATPAIPAGLVIVAEPTARPPAATVAPTTVAPATVVPTTAPTTATSIVLVVPTTLAATTAPTPPSVTPTTAPAVVAGIQVDRSVAFTGSDSERSVAEFALPLTFLGGLLYLVSRLRRRYRPRHSDATAR